MLGRGKADFSLARTSEIENELLIPDDLIQRTDETSGPWPEQKLEREPSEEHLDSLKETAGEQMAPQYTNIAESSVTSQTHNKPAFLIATVQQTPHLQTGSTFYNYVSHTGYNKDASMLQSAPT